MISAPGAKIERRILVVGAPRSGTTLVQSLLAAHSGLTSFTESHLFAGHFSLVPWSSRALLTRHPGPRLREFLVENGEEPTASAAWFGADGSRALRFGPLLPLLTRPAARRLLRVLDELARRRGKPGWLEKTPRHLRYIPFLERVAGAGAGLRFVHVVRDGLDVAASLHRASQEWERPYDLETCARRWNADVALSVGRIGARTDQFVIYEQLTASPEAALKRLLGGLDLDWEPEILERYATASGGLVTAREQAWKGEVGREIRRSQTARQTLSEAQRLRLGRALRRDLYERLRKSLERPAVGAEGAGA